MVVVTVVEWIGLEKRISLSASQGASAICRPVDHVLLDLVLETAPSEWGRMYVSLPLAVSSCSLFTGVVVMEGDVPLQLWGQYAVWGEEDIFISDYFVNGL